MNKKVVFVLGLYIFMVGACNKDEEITVTTGIIGSVEYGQGDCMPVIDYGSRVYNDYNGRIYFVVKDNWDNLGDGDYEQLKRSSISVRVKQGKLSAELPAETYLVMPEEIYMYSDKNTITIKAGEVLNKDFQFFKCTTF